MRKIVKVSLMILGCVLPVAAQTRVLVPAEANVRFSEQISNGPAGKCGCFAMEGIAGDFAWQVRTLGKEGSNSFAGVADFGVEHTGSVNGAPYGLTLTTLSFGPRFARTFRKSSSVFAQTLFGAAFGSNSQFPEHNALVSSANSFAFDLGGGIEHRLGNRLAWRLIQADYLRTSLPNNSSNWQNNLRIATGLTIHLK